MFVKMVLTGVGGILEGGVVDGYVLFQGTALVFNRRKEIKPREVSLPIACRPGETGIAYPRELASQNLPGISYPPELALQNLPAQ